MTNRYPVTVRNVVLDWTALSVVTRSAYPISTAARQVHVQGVVIFCYQSGPAWPVPAPLRRVVYVFLVINNNFYKNIGKVKQVPEQVLASKALRGSIASGSRILGKFAVRNSIRTLEGDHYAPLARGNFKLATRMQQLGRARQRPRRCHLIRKLTCIPTYKLPSNTGTHSNTIVYMY